MKVSSDHTIFAWNRSCSWEAPSFIQALTVNTCGLLAQSPADFAHAGGYIPWRSSTGREYTVTNRGLRIETLVYKESDYGVALLRCRHTADLSRSVGILICAPPGYNIEMFIKACKDTQSGQQQEMPELFDIRRRSPSSLILIPLELAQDHHNLDHVRLYCPHPHWQSTWWTHRLSPDPIDFLFSCSPRQSHTIQRTFPATYLGSSDVYIPNERGKPVAALFLSTDEGLPPFVIAVIQAHFRKSQAHCQIITDRGLCLSMDMERLRSLHWPSSTPCASTVHHDSLSVKAVVELRRRSADYFYVVDVETGIHECQQK